MASGKKNYFRHSFYAHKDDKIMSLVDKHGKEAYFHFFVILELCGEQASESMPESFVFHPRTLCSALLVRRHRLLLKLLQLQDESILEVVHTEDKVELRIPNFPKYLGYYQSKLQTKTPNKRKEKERKVNKKKTDKSKTNDAYQPIVEEITNYLGQKIGKNLNPNTKLSRPHIIARLKEGYTLEQFKHVVDIKYDEWSTQPRMVASLTARTLFGPKMENYVNQCEVQPANNTKEISDIDAKLLKLMGINETN